MFYNKVFSGHKLSCFYKIPIFQNLLLLMNDVGWIRCMLISALLMQAGAMTTESVQWLAMGWTIRVLGFDTQQGLGIFLFTIMSGSALGPTQPPIQWVLGALSLGVKRPGREADHSPPSLHLVPRSRMHGAILHSPKGLHGVLLS
jgi:hypothetical protein